MKVIELNSKSLYGNTSIETLDISAKVPISDKFAENATNLTYITLDNEGEIGYKAFYGCSRIKSLSIGNSTTNICEKAFCEAMTETWAGEMTLNNNGIIGDNAFFGCSGLKVLSIGNTVTNIGENAFSESMTRATKGEMTLVNNGKIGNNAFSGCTGLTKASLAQTITSIGDGCFSGCQYLESINIPNIISNIPEKAFCNCTSLKNIILPSELLSIGKNAFDGAGIESITIDPKTSYIGSGAFKNCKSLTKFIILDDVEPLNIDLGYGEIMLSSSPLKEVVIGRILIYPTNQGYRSPFYRNTSLESVIITDHPTEVLKDEFSGCSGLKEVKIGSGVTTIGDYAFSGCSALYRFTIGSNIKSIGVEAFSDCTAMSEFYAESTIPPTCGTQALDDINKWNCILYVPESAIDYYREANQWKEFFFIEKYDFTTFIENVTFDNSTMSKFDVYDLNGLLRKKALNIDDIYKMPTGIYIVNGKKIIIK